MNEFALIGTLVSVGPLEETSSGIKVINFFVKTDRPYKSSVAFDEFKITAFKELAEEISLKKVVGSDVLVRGRIQSNNYSRDDKVYYSSELLAEKVMHVVR